MEKDISRHELRRRIKKSTNQVQEIIREHQKERRVWMVANGTPVTNVANLLVQPLLFRSLELMQSTLYDVKKNYLFSALSSARTHFELTGTLATLLKKLREYAEEKITQDDILAYLKRLNLGVGKDRRDEYPDIDVSSVHVLNRIRDVDEIAPYDVDPNFKVFYTGYGDLSEFVHMNFSGTEMTIKHYPKFYFVDFYDPDKILLMKARTLNWLIISSKRFWWFYQEIMHLLQKKEGKLPQMHKMPMYTFRARRFGIEMYANTRIFLHRKGIWRVKKSEPIK